MENAFSALKSTNDQTVICVSWVRQQVSKWRCFEDIDVLVGDHIYISAVHIYYACLACVKNV